MQTKLSLIDLFAGCGEQSLGLEQAGFCPVFVNELNEHAMATHLLNRHCVNPSLTDRTYHVNDVTHMLLDKKYRPALQSRLKADRGIDTGEN